MYLWYVKTHGKILLHFILVNMKNKIPELSSIMVNKVLIVFDFQGRTQFTRSVVSESAIPWITARQASLSITKSRGLPKLMSSELVMPSSHLILCHPHSSCPQSLSASGSVSMSQIFTWGVQSIGVSASPSVLPKNTKEWFPLEWTGWISLHSKGLSGVFFNTTVQKHQFFSAQPSSQSNSHIHTWPPDKP